MSRSRFCRSFPALAACVAALTNLLSDSVPARAASNVACVNFVSDSGFVLRQANGYTVVFENNAPAPQGDTGLYSPQKHGAYGLDAKGERIIDGTITYLDTLDESDVEFRLDWVDGAAGARSRTYRLKMGRVDSNGVAIDTWTPSGKNHYRMVDMTSNDPRDGDLAWWPVDGHRFRCGAERSPNEADGSGVFRIHDAGPDWVTD